MFHQSNKFLRMVGYTLAGALLGLLAGLIFGLLIQAISGLIPPMSGMEEGPQVVAPFLGMGLGTLVGALLGGAVSMRA